MKKNVEFYIDNRKKYKYPWDIRDFLKDIIGLDGAYYKFVSYNKEEDKVYYKSIRGECEHSSSLSSPAWIKLSIRKI